MEEKLTQEIEKLTSHVEGLLQKESEAITESAKTEVRNELKSLEAKYGELLEKQGKTVSEIRNEIQDTKAELTKLKDFGGTESKTLNQIFNEKSKEIAAHAKKVKEEFGSVVSNKNYSVSDANQFIMQTKAAADMTLGNFSGNASVTYKPDGVMILPRNVHVRDLLSVGTMSTEILQYEVETANDGTAALAAEGDAVALIDNDFTSTTAQAYKIGARYRTSEESLADVSWLSSFIQRRGVERVLQAEDGELLTGTTEIVGLSVNATNDTVGTGYPLTDASLVPNKFDALMFAIIKLSAINVTPNGILMSPVDCNALYQARATDGQYLAEGRVYWQGGQMFIMGVPVYKSTAVTAGTFYVGDWSADSAEVMQRDGLSVRFFDQDEDNAQKNLVTVRIQERIAFPIYRPTSFLFGTFADIIASLSV